MEQKIQQLESQVKKLQEMIDFLQDSSLIPRDVETAFSERLNIVSGVFGTGTSTATTQSVPLSGNAENITVPAQPSGTLTVTYKGTTYNLLYK